MRILLLLMISTSLFALSPKPASQQKQAIVYHNATIHLGNGKVLENATLAFDKGKITRIGHFKMAWQPSDIDLKGKHIYPGFILPVTNLGLSEVSAVRATKDDNETGQLNANVRAIVAYNTDSEITPTLKFNGVLLAQITPVGGLISGLSSIVQLDAWNWQDAAIITDDAVHVNWPSSKRARFDFATFTMKTEDNKNFDKQLKQIKSLFKSAKNDDQSNLKIKAVRPTITKNRRVYIHTNNAKSIIQAINFFKEVGVKNSVLVTGQGVEPVIGFVKKSQVPVIVNIGHDLPDRADKSVDDGYNIAVKLNNAGILTALAYQGGMMMSSRNLAFTAGTLVAYGLSKEQALKIITSNTAKILGIDDKYGTLEQGKSATFFISDGDALDMRSNVIQDAYIDGRRLTLKGRQQKLNKRFLNKYKLD